MPIPAVATIDDGGHGSLLDLIVDLFALPPRITFKASDKKNIFRSTKMFWRASGASYI